MKEIGRVDEIVCACSGCSACYSICPKKAISMQENEEGFLYPVIDEQKCTNCGLCAKICPVKNPKYTNTSSPDCYAAMAKDDIRKESSSGGIFPVLAYKCLENGGYVAGAVWEGQRVIHIVSNKKEDIEKMRKSKYLQSSMEECYSQIKNLLEENNEVLFTGTPCQIAGLKSFLRKDYDTLFTVEIICHGTPSPMVFRKYLEETLNETEEFITTDFRDKVRGWNPSLTTTTTTTTRKISFKGKDDIFLQAFLNNMCLRSSCGECRFNKLPRQADMTIGDFWKIEKYSKNLDDKQGTSVILVNNEKGVELLNNIQKKLKTVKNVPLKYAITGNHNIVGSSLINPNRERFMKSINEIGLQKSVDYYENDKCDYLIVNFWNTHDNYGAVLTAYAMQELVRSFGFLPKIFNAGEQCFNQHYKNSIVEHFASRFLDLTHNLNFAKSYNLTKKIKGVILGSDQVLRLDYIKDILNKYFLNFVHPDCKKLAISASFGIDKQEFLANKNFTKKVAKKMKTALQSFDYLSCRELSGKEIYKDVFGLNSDMILDPVFIVDKEIFSSIAKLSTNDYQDKVVSYVLDETLSFNELDKRLNIETIKINDKNRFNSVEDWLNAIISCKCLITDSFHGACFAIIFNKPFICIRNEDRGNARFSTLSEITGIKENFISDFSLVNALPVNMDYSEANNKIAEEKLRCLEIIKNVLTSDYSNNDKKVGYNYHKSNGLMKLKLYCKYKTCKLKYKLFKKRKEHYKLKMMKTKYFMDWS